jgi:hypothetical protein
MAARHIALFLLFATLSACAGVTASPTVEQGELAQLSRDNSGIVLIHATINGRAPNQVGVSLARRGESGRYVVWRSGVPIKFPQDSGAVPGQLKIPAGEYAIVEVNALDLGVVISTTRQFRAPNMKYEGALLIPSYERPIARFTVGPGEVVDVGSLQITEGRRESLLFETQGNFTANVAPTPEPLLRNLAARNPNLYKARVVRTMTRPGPTS